MGIKYSILRKTYTYNFFYNLVRRISYKIYNRNKKKEFFKNNYKYFPEEINSKIVEFNNNKYEKYKNYLKSMKNFMELNDGELLVFFNLH